MLTGPKRVARTQAGLAIVLGLAAFATAEHASAVALAYGTLVALASTVLLVRNERSAIRHPEWDGPRLFRVFVRTGVERYGAVVGLLALGFGVFELAPLPTLSGLALAQLAWIAAAVGPDNKLKI